MVATSQPLATRAGLRMLERGGNAADAALAAAAVLCVTEPMSTGIGGDCFAHRLARRAARGARRGRARARAARRAAAPVASDGPRSVTVPGAVAGWAALAERYGRLGLDACLARRDRRRRATASPSRRARRRCWRARLRRRAELGPPPRVGDVGPPARARRDAARDRRARGRTAFYGGAVARGDLPRRRWLEEDDLAGVRAALGRAAARCTYRGVEVLELPPPTQGVAALEALGLLERLDADARRARSRCVQLALEDAFARVRDGADVSRAARPRLPRAAPRAARRRRVAEPAGGTVYLCAVDGDRMAVSFIQSLFERLRLGRRRARARASCCRTAARASRSAGAVEPGRRPYHTIIPGHAPAATARCSARSA